MNPIAVALQYRIQTHTVITKGLAYVIVKEPAHERDSTAIHKGLFLQMLEKTRGIVTVCCDKVGIARATYYVWMNNDPKFKALVEEIMKMKADFLEDTVFVMAHKDFQAAKYLLEKIHPEFKKKPRDSKETIVNIYHHATPPGELKKDGDKINLCLSDLLTLSEYDPKDDLEKLDPETQKLIKRFKPILDFMDEYRYSNDEEGHADNDGDS